MLPTTHQHPVGDGTRNCRKAWNTLLNVFTVFGHALRWDHKQWTVFLNVQWGTPSSLIPVIKCSTKGCVNAVACFHDIHVDSWLDTQYGNADVCFYCEVRSQYWVSDEWQTPYLFWMFRFMQAKQRKSLFIHPLSFTTLPCTAGVGMDAGLQPGQVGSRTKKKKRHDNEFAFGVTLSDSWTSGFQKDGRPLHQPPVVIIIIAKYPDNDCLSSLFFPFCL